MLHWCTHRDASRGRHVCAAVEAVEIRGLVDWAAVRTHLGINKGRAHLTVRRGYRQ